MLRHAAGTEGGSESGARGDSQCSSMGLSHSDSFVIGVILCLFASFSSLGRMTWLGEYRSSHYRNSHKSRNWVVGVPSDMVAMSRRVRPKDPCGKYGELVKISFKTMAGLCESHWTRVGSTTEGFTFACSEWQKVVTIPSFPLLNPSVMKIVIGMISLLLTFLLKWVAWPHTLGMTSLVKSPSDTIKKLRVCKQGSSLMDTHYSAGNDGTKLGSARSLS